LKKPAKKYLRQKVIKASAGRGKPADWQGEREGSGKSRLVSELAINAEVRRLSRGPSQRMMTQCHEKKSHRQTYSARKKEWQARKRSAKRSKEHYKKNGKKPARKTHMGSSGREGVTDSKNDDAESVKTV